MDKTSRKPNKRFHLYTSASQASMRANAVNDMLLSTLSTLQE